MEWQGQIAPFTGPRSTSHKWYSMTQGYVQRFGRNFKKYFGGNTDPAFRESYNRIIEIGTVRQVKILPFY